MNTTYHISVTNYSFLIERIAWSLYCHNRSLCEAQALGERERGVLYYLLCLLLHYLRLEQRFPTYRRQRISYGVSYQNSTGLNKSRDRPEPGCKGQDMFR